MIKKRLLLLAFVVTTFARAQEGATDLEGNIPPNDRWYSSPWLWIVGAAMFIIVLVALTKGKKD
jgi:hypothetical protein